MYNFGSFDAFIVKPTILPEICSTSCFKGLIVASCTLILLEFHVYHKYFRKYAPQGNKKLDNIVVFLENLHILSIF